MSEKITIIGAGNGGVTAAYHLSRLGREICIYDLPEFDRQIQGIQEKGGICAKEMHNGDKLLFPGFEKNITATTDMEKAIAFSDTLLMICPSFAQETMFDKMLPFLRDHQIVILLPGNFGGLVLYHKLQQSGRDIDVTFVDGISIPWATRLEDIATVDIMGIKEFLPVSVFPHSHLNDELKRKIELAIPIPVEYLASPVQAGLGNINFGGHPLMTTVNIGLLENFPQQFTYYRDCCSTATARATAKMDKERLAVGEAYGYQLRPELVIMNALYHGDAKSVYEFNRGSETHGKVKDSPGTSMSRYITEDVPYLLVPIWHLAQKAGLHPVIMESVIHLASAYNDEDYFSTGRTMEKMGLSEMTLEEIKEYLAQ